MYAGANRFPALAWKTRPCKRLTPARVLTNLILWPIAAQQIRIGQVWKKVGTDETFLVTKLYNEALTTIAVLRPTGAATESMIRVRVERTRRWPGFTRLHDGPGTAKGTSAIPPR